MFVIYGLLALAMFAGIWVLLKPQRMKRPQGPHGVGHAGSKIANEGGNSSKAEQENLATNGDNTGGTLPLGADNDDDRTQRP